MAARAGRLIQDQNLNIHFNGKADFTEQKKVLKGGGRKPLGDLSNTRKSSLHEAPKQLKSSNNLTIINEEAATASKGRNVDGNKRAVSKASGKSQNGNRKALSDISNSGKLPLLEIRNKNVMKLSVLTEEPLYPGNIAGEQILHNHQECVKSHSKAMDMGQFLETLGLENDKVVHLASSSELPAFSKPETDLESEEIPERLTEVQSSGTEHGSPVLCKTPKLSDCYPMWKDFEVNFKLMETPNLSKY